jgi:hypothetical protein
LGGFLDKNKHSCFTVAAMKRKKQFGTTDNYDHVRKSFYFVNLAKEKSQEIPCRSLSL